MGRLDFGTNSNVSIFSRLAQPPQRQPAAFGKLSPLCQTHKLIFPRFQSREVGRSLRVCWRCENNTLQSAKIDSEREIDNPKDTLFLWLHLKDRKVPHEPAVSAAAPPLHLRKYSDFPFSLISLFLVSWYLAGFFHAAHIMVLAAAETMLFLAMYPLSWYLRSRVQLSAESLQNLRLHTEKDALCSVTVENTGVLPVTKVQLKWNLGYRRNQTASKKMKRDKNCRRRKESRLFS